MNMERVAAFSLPVALHQQTGGGRLRNSVSRNAVKFRRCSRTSSRIATRVFATAAASSSPTDAPPDYLDPELIEQSFERLKHPNPMQRKAASSRLGFAGTPEVISRLVGLLSEEDTSHRRSAVQALGMCGAAAIGPLVEMLRTTSNITVRASCSKALAAIALFYPEMRVNFSSDALEALGDAVRGSDPVTKLASVGCLGTLGSDMKSREGETFAGNDKAYETLVGMLEEGMDVAIGAVAVGAVAQIAQNGTPDRKENAISMLKKVAVGSDASDSGSGLSYVREMAKSHVEQLEGAKKESPA